MCINFAKIAQCSRFRGRNWYVQHSLDDLETGAQALASDEANEIADPLAMVTAETVAPRNSALANHDMA